MEYLEAQVLLKNVKIAVAMQQYVTVGQTKRCDQTIHHFAYCPALLPHASEISRCRYGQLQSARLKNLKFQKLPLKQAEFALAAYALQYLAQDQIRKPDPSLVGFVFNPISFWIPDSPKVIYPNGGINNDHPHLLFVPPSPQFIQVSLPVNLAAQAPDPGLTPHLHQQPQCFFDRRAFGTCAAAPHRLPHQLVVNLDIGTHRSNLYV
jgi:hypothetical protein